MQGHPVIHPMHRLRSFASEYVHFIISMLLLLACGLQTSAVMAQTYPTRPIRILVPYSAGGGVDFVIRILAQELSGELGQSVLVENKPGGSTNIAADTVARSAPDGYTLFAASRANAVNATLFKNLSFDILKDFTTISLLAEIPNILVISPKMPVTNVAELIALAKKDPGKLTYASAGTAGSTHLAGELFSHMAGVELVHVPYRGGSPAAVDLIAGQVDMYFATMPSVMNYVRAGKLRALAVTSLNRSKAEPGYLSLNELGLQGFRETSWIGLLAPAGTPEPIIQRLSQVSVSILQRPEVRAKLLAQGAEAIGSTQQEFAAFLREDITDTAKLLKNAKIQME